jgi:serine/threonine-protein kinase HipA
MNRIQVHLDLDGRTVAVGTLYLNRRRGRLTSTFAYHPAYLTEPGAYAIDPELPLVAGNQAVGPALPRAFADAAPDRWGRNLIRQRIELEARAAGARPRTADEVDYLLGVSDGARQGALRFTLSAGGDFQHPGDRVPGLIELPRLLGAADRIGQADPSPLAAVKELLEAGSASLGGARPKAAVTDQGELLIAKFPHPGDQWDVCAWEAATLDQAEQAGIAVPPRRLVRIADRSVLLTRRFDRAAGRRIGYFSGLTLCRRADGERGDYLDLAEDLSLVSADPVADLAELWRRIAFGYGIGNTDDHLRNHGLLRHQAGWRLAPAFDLNPEPEPGNHATSIAGETAGRAGLRALRASAEAFGLTQDQAEASGRQVGDAIVGMVEAAQRRGVPESEIGRFAAGFVTPEAALA